jgi:deoxyribodipyrimidine photo-lyase
MLRSIVWFKTDLRLHDNETLVRAIASGDEVIPVYCFDDSHFKTSEYGFKKTGAFRAQFLMESLADLDMQLRALGSGLLLLRGKPEYELYKVAVNYKAQKLFAKKEVGFEEKQTEKLVEAALWKAGCSVEYFSTSTLYHAADLPFSMKDIPDVFTKFRKRIEEECLVRPVFEKPLLIKSPALPVFHLPPLGQFGLLPVNMDNRAALLFKGGETEGIKRLHYYLYESNCISTYKNTRNGLIGGDYSTKFSAWLAIGCLSPREIYNELMRYEANFGANDSTYWLVFELLWRDYFRFMMKKYQHRFFLHTGIHPHKIPSTDKNEELLHKWINAETGIDFIDANMLELKLTGFMSNRGRQNVASYLCHDLKLDWRYGAAYFEEQLIDYDVCSNWGNWAYVAGVGNDPREDRYFNIQKQATTYDPKNKYTQLWLNKN